MRPPNLGSRVELPAREFTVMIAKPADRPEKRPRRFGLSFWVSLVTFLLLFGLLVFGGILGITNLIRMLWRILSNL